MYQNQKVRVQVSMRNSLSIRGLFGVLLVLASVLNFGQQGSPGGAAAGGGFGQGNIGGAEEASYPPQNIESGQEGTRWVSNTAILTQGDKVEFKVKGVPGQTILATVRSSVFDPSLKLLDSKGKVVVENDDQYEGNQSPLLMFQFTDDKDYKLIVQNYRSNGGGQFKLYLQTFSATELSVGENKKPLKLSDGEPGHGGSFVYFHFKGEVGKNYAIRELNASVNGGARRLRSRGIIGPTGVKRTDYSLYEQFEGFGPLFEVKTKGDFYMVYDSPQQSGSASARLDVVEATKVEKVSAQKFDLGVTGQRIFKFDVAKEDIIRTISNSSEKVSYHYLAQGAEDSKSGERSKVDIHDYVPTMFNDREHIRVYEDKGEVTLIVSNGAYEPTSVSFSNAMDVPKWIDDTSQTGNLKLGESKFFTIEANKGDIQRIKGSAIGFELTFKLISMNGSDTDYIDQRTHLPSAELRYTDKAKYLVEVTSPSGGGSGTYSLALEVAKPEPIELGKVFEYRDGPAVGTYALKVEKGVRYQLLSPENLSFTILDEVGDEIPNVDVPFGKQTVQWFTPTKTGTIRLKVVGGPQGLKFRVDKHLLPEIGG
ncbi:MAG: hypothetical protein WCI55_15660 [Armatimonadota bacterium]